MFFGVEITGCSSNAGRAPSCDFHRRLAAGADGGERASGCVCVRAWFLNAGCFSIWDSSLALTREHGGGVTFAAARWIGRAFSARRSWCVKQCHKQPSTCSRQEAMIPSGVSAGAGFHKVVIWTHKGVSNIGQSPCPRANQDPTGLPPGFPTLSTLPHLEA